EPDHGMSLRSAVGRLGIRRLFQANGFQSLEIFKNERLAGDVEALADSPPEETPLDRPKAHAIATKGLLLVQREVVKLMLHAEEGQAFALSGQDSQEGIEAGKKVIDNLGVLDRDADIDRGIERGHHESDHELSGVERHRTAETAHHQSEKTRQTEIEER